MCNSILHDLDSTLSIVGNDVTPDVRLAVLSEDNNTIESALFNLIAPDQRHGPCLVVVADNLQAIHV